MEKQITENEAIGHLRDLQTDLKEIIYVPSAEKYKSSAIKMAIEALEKQIPKIPDIWGDGYSGGQIAYDMYDCPNCGESYEIECDHYKYCPKCGQAIDRSGLE